MLVKDKKSNANILAPSKFHKNSFLSLIHLFQSVEQEQTNNLLNLNKFCPKVIK